MQVVASREFLGHNFVRSSYIKPKKTLEIPKNLKTLVICSPGLVLLSPQGHVVCHGCCRLMQMRTMFLIWYAKHVSSIRRISRSSAGRDRRLLENFTATKVSRRIKHFSFVQRIFVDESVRTATAVLWEQDRQMAGQDAVCSGADYGFQEPGVTITCVWIQLVKLQAFGYPYELWSCFAMKQKCGEFI